MAISHVTQHIRAASHVESPKAAAAPAPLLRRAKQAKRSKLTLVLDCHNGEELLFQFCGRDGFPLADLVGTVSNGQAWQAERKLLLLRKTNRTIDLGFKLWGVEETSEDTDNSNGAEGSAGSPEEPADSSSSSNGDGQASVDDLDGTYWEPPLAVHPEDYEDAHDVSGEADARQQGHRFRHFAAREERLGYASSGWVALGDEDEQQDEYRLDEEDSFDRQDVEPYEEDHFDSQVEMDQSARMLADSDELVEEESSSSSNGTAPQLVAKPYWPLVEEQAQAEHAERRAQSEGRAAEQDRDTEAKRAEAEANSQQAATEQDSSAGASSSGVVSSNDAPPTLLRVLQQRILRWLAGLMQTVQDTGRTLQAAYFACLFLVRRAWWAASGWPPPPRVHASPTVAQLRLCNDQEQAKQFSYRAGYDGQGKTKAPLADLPRWRMEALLRTHVCDMSLYRRALTAPSVVRDSIGKSFERLEFLGDAVLEVIIRDYVYTKHPEVNESAMNAMVSGLVCGRTLHDFARQLHLERYLAVNAQAQYHMRNLSGFAGGTLADTFEALLAALFKDRGYSAARDFVLRLVKDFVDFDRLPLNRDYKGILGTILCILKLKRAVYRSRVVEGDSEAAAALHPLVSGLPSEDMGRLWVSDVSVGDFHATGCDIHRTTSEQQAARKALILLGLNIEELTLLDSGQVTLQSIARKLPGLQRITQEKRNAGQRKGAEVPESVDDSAEQLKLESVR